MTDRTARRLAICIVAATGLFVAAFAVFRLASRREPHVEVDRTLYPVAGLDISAHNGFVDFDSAAAAGID